jgi:predicted nucleic acid-binding protein
LLDLRCLTTCSVVDLEVLYSARSPAEYLSVLTDLRVNYVNLPITQEICARAIDVQSQLVNVLSTVPVVRPISSSLRAPNCTRPRSCITTATSS